MSEKKVIDLHAHVVLEAGFGQAGPFGPEMSKDKDGVPFFRIGDYQMKPMEYRGSVFMETDLRLERMDQDGIDLQMLSPNPLTMFHHIPADIALHFCQIQHDAMADLVSRHDCHLEQIFLRVIGFATNGAAEESAA